MAIVIFVSWSQGWQYGTVRSEFAYYVPRTLNRTVPAYRTSVQFLKRTVPTCCTRTITKKAYCTSVPYFLTKIEAYHTNVPYRTATLALNYSQLYTLKNKAVKIIAGESWRERASPFYPKLKIQKFKICIYYS